MNSDNNTTPESNQEPLIPEPISQTPIHDELTNTIEELKSQETKLRRDISELQANYAKMLQEQLIETQATYQKLAQQSLSDLEQRKQALEISIEQLEKRRDRMKEEMRTTFAGVSQDLAIRVQGFKDYLVGSLQDLVSSVEELELIPETQPSKPQAVSNEPSRKENPSPQFSQQTFAGTTKQIRSLLEQYRTRPDYYGSPWQLRRTFEPVHVDRASNWFFNQGGRGSLRSMGSRLQNILVGSAIISVLRTIYDERLKTLVLANTPERLGEWRRGLQDCLGISRSDFGPDRGITLFESPEVVVQRCDRLMSEGYLPFIIIDEAENEIRLSLLQFPLWLAFAPDPQQLISDFNKYDR